MKKKVLLWIGGTVLLLFILLLTMPFLFKSKIEEMVLKTINQNVAATVNFNKVDLSLLKGFPKATVSIDGLSIINNAPFQGDTLLYAGNIGLKMSVMELFNGADKPMKIEDILVKDAKVKVLVNEQGVANYDIAIKKEDEQEDQSDDTPFSLSLNQYEVSNLALTYTDLSSKMSFEVKDLFHKGKGNLVANVLDLDTESTANVSFVMDGTKFLNGVALSLKAVIGMDLDKQTYTFKDNEALINQLPLKFNGSIQLLENGQAYDLTFATPTSDFKNFLGLVPEAYAGNLKGVSTTGNFEVSGKVSGQLTETTIPTLAIHMASDNASFKYPDLPKSVQNIVLDVNVVNTTGAMNDTYVDINKLSFKIDQDVFSAQANIKNIMENALVSAKVNGVINLANVTKAYPVQLDKPLTGVLRANVTTSFDMNSVEKSQYQNIKNSGTMSLTGFNFETDAMAKPLAIQEAALTFNPNNVSLNKFKMLTGNTDITAEGRLDNLYGFLFNKQTLKGNFLLNSNNFVLADLLKEDTAPAQPKEAEAERKAATTSEPLKIPGFLDCTITANAKIVVYDNLTLKNVKGRLIIRDEAAKLEDMSTDIFGGGLTFAGTVSTKEAVPKFDMDLGLNTLDITQTFSSFEFLKKVAPIAGIIKGKVNAAIKLNGQLDSKTLSPILNVLSGDLRGDFVQSELTPQNSQLLSALAANIRFVDLNKLNLNNAKMHLIFNNGKVFVKPFTVKLQDMAVQVSGEHGFDQNIDYTLDFTVPAKYLGNDVTKLLSTLSPKDASKFDAIPVKVGLVGNFAKPKVSTNMNEVVTDNTKSIVEEQSNKLVGKGKDALLDALTGTKNKGDGTVKDSTATNTKRDQTEEVVNKLGEGLKGLFNKNKK